MALEMFDSAIRSKGDLAAVFEHDGETYYFYLYDDSNAETQKIIAALFILSGEPDFNESDVVIRWNVTENIVALFIRGHLWAAFDARTAEKHGGNYQSHGETKVPLWIIQEFGDVPPGKR